MTIKRRALSILLSLAVIFTFMPFVSAQAYAASKQPLVTKQVDNDGTTNTYSYNAKGLVKKMVSKHSSSDNDSDSKYSATTTFKYNKKNKISSQTTKATTSTTSYRTDNTTGKQRVANEGTVKDKYNTVTKYTYKKGLATKAVTTETYTKSGSTIDTTKSLSVPGYAIRKLSDGSYRYKDAKTNEYKFLSAAEAAGYAETSTSTTTYSDNGTTYTETDSDWTYEWSPQSITRKNQTVTTTNFKYKKKNVKTAKVTVVETEEDTTIYKDGTVYKDSVVKTYNPVTYSYSYKKGRVSKKTTSDPQTYNKVRTETWNNKDGSVEVDTTTEDAYGNITFVATVNGVVTDSKTTPGTKKVYTAKDTVTYKYDKNGNLKSMSGKDTRKNDTTVRDEEYYSSYIPMIVSATSENNDYVTTPVSSVYKWSTSFQNTVKKGTKKLLTAVGMSKYSKDGRASGNKGSYSMDRTKYTLKSKKYAKKASANVEAQQWMIQNGVFKVPGLW